MGIYGYCVLPSGQATPPAVSGLAGAAVRPHQVGELVVWVSEIERPEPNAENLKKHNDVIEAAVTEQVTPVPLRFGQWSPDAAVFDSVVSERSNWYHERLAAFAGALEFGLRAVRPEKENQARVVRVAPVATGTDYMRALRANAAATRAELEEAERLRKHIAELVGDVVRDHRDEAPRTPRAVLTLSHLVGRKDFGEYRGRVQSLRESFPELRFLITGPWAPYSFAT